MPRPTQTRTGKRTIGPKTRFAPDLLALEDRSVPASIYVDLAFTGTDGSAPGQAFNATGAGPLGTVPAAGLTFVSAGDPNARISAGTTKSFATADITTAFNAARDNPGPDTILLAGGGFALDNSQGQSATLSGGFNNNTYFFNTDPLTILGSGKGLTTVRPTADTFAPATPDTQSDPVFAVRNGATFTGRDFTFDGGGKLIGVGIGVSGGTNATVTNLAVNNFVALDGSTTGGTPFGFGIAVNPNAGAAVKVTTSSFQGNARAGVSFLNADGQVIGSTFTGRGAGKIADVGVQVYGTGSVYVTGSTFTNYKGSVAATGEQASGIVAAQDAVLGVPVPGGATLLAVGNSLTGNAVGVVLGSLGLAGDTSKAVVQFNDLSGNTTALDATRSLFGPAVATGVDAGIDGRFNFYGAGGPNRQASTGSNGDALTNPGGTGSKADGNVRINGFRTTPITPTVPLSSTVGVTLGTADSTQSLAVATKFAVVPFQSNPAAPASTLIIYVNGTNGPANNAFTDVNADNKADQQFNPTGAGPLGTGGTTAGTVRFVAGGTPYSTLGFALGSTNKIAVPDVTTAFNLARDNPGADTIFLAASDSPYTLDNSQGQSATLSGGFNDNTYFFNNSPLTISGSGLANSVIRPTASAYDPANADTASDPVMAIRQGTAFTGSNFSLDGSGGRFGGGVGVSGGSAVVFDRVGLRNFVAEGGAGTGGASSGYGLFVNPNAGGSVKVSNSQFSGNGRYGVGVANSTAQIFCSTFTGRGAGDLVDYGVAAIGTSSVLVTGSTLSGYQGKASGDGTESAALFSTEDVDPVAGTPVPGAASLLVVGNSITGNRIGVAVGSSIAGGSLSNADVRFNDLSNNARALDAAQAAAGAARITAPNNFFGDPVGPTGTGSRVVANGGNVTYRGAGDATDVFRAVAAPVVCLDTLTFGSTAANSTSLGAAGAAAAAAYVIDPRVQSEAFLSGPAVAAGKDVVVTVTYTDPLAVKADGTRNQDKSLVTVSVTDSKGVTTALTPAQYTVGTPSGDGKTVLVTVTAATLAGLTGTKNGTVTVIALPSSGAANTGNTQLTVNGFQTGGPNPLPVAFGVANTGPTISPNPATTVVVSPTSPTSPAVPFTVTVGTGRTIASVVPASSNPLVTVTRVPGSPDSAPQFTVTSTATTPGVAVVTVTVTDSDGQTAVSTLPVQYGVANSGVSLTPIGNLTYNVNGPAQTVGTTVTYSPGRTGTVSFSVSPNNLVTVVQGGTSTSPTFTLTPIPGATGNGVVTVTATDSDGIKNSTAFAVQVGAGVAPTISGLPDATIPFAGSTGPLTVNVAGANQPLTVVGTSSNPNVATVTVTGTGATRTVTVTANPNLTTGGSTAISLRVTDSQGISTVESFNVTVAPQRVRRFAAGTGPGNGVGSSAAVQVYDVNGVRLFGFTPFELSFTGGVSVATGDVNADGVDDIVVGASIGGGPRVKVFDGLTGITLADFFAYEGENRNGVTVAVGKVLDTGTDARGYFREQVIAGAGDGGGPRVVVYDVTAGKGSSPTRVGDFFAYESTFRNGVTVGAGDLNGDGLAEIVTGSGFGGGPRVRSFSATGAPAGLDFFAFDQAYRGGISVAAGDLDASGRASVIVGVGPDGGSLVRVFNSGGVQKSQFQAYGDASTAPKAVRVGSVQFGTGGESIVTGPGVGGGPRLQVFRGTNPTSGAVYTDFAFAEAFRGGIFVG